jgi:hypothetical protein
MVRTRVGGTPLSCPNTLTPNMTTTADVAQFILRRQIVSCGAQHFWSDLCIGRSDLRRSASFCGLCPHTSDLTYSHTKKSGVIKSGEFVGHGMGPSCLYQRLLRVSSKNSHTMRDQCGGVLSCWKMMVSSTPSCFSCGSMSR